MVDVGSAAELTAFPEVLFYKAVKLRARQGGGQEVDGVSVAVVATAVARLVEVARYAKGLSWV